MKKLKYILPTLFITNLGTQYLLEVYSYHGNAGKSGRP